MMKIKCKEMTKLVYLLGANNSRLINMKWLSDNLNPLKKFFDLEKKSKNSKIYKN